MDLVHTDVDGIHVVEGGDPASPPVLFLHGWPESWLTWEGVLAAAGDRARLVAIDLPGIGGSAAARTDGSTAAVAASVATVVDRLGLTDLTIVGHDFGGMVVYPYLRLRTDLKAAVIMDVVIPGVDPWEAVLANPYIWHFDFHAVPEVPELLVQGRQAAYFDWFFASISADESRIGPEHRAGFAAAYADDSALAAGFDWYRHFPADAEHNAGLAGPSSTPLLYLRGDAEGGSVDDYVAGLTAAGLSDVRAATIADAGHFAQEEQPEAVWDLIADVAGL